MNLKDQWTLKFWVDSLAFHNDMVRGKYESLELEFPVAL